MHMEILLPYYYVLRDLVQISDVGLQEHCCTTEAEAWFLGETFTFYDMYSSWELIRIPASQQIANQIYFGKRGIVC